MEGEDGQITIKVEDVPCAVVGNRLEAVLLLSAALYVFAQKRPTSLRNITIFTDIMVFGVKKPGPVPGRVRLVIAELSALA